MIITPRIAARLVAILIAAAILELSFLSHMTFFGVVPDLLSVVVVCFGLLGGAVLGAGFGFAMGLLIDALLIQTLGVMSLVLLSVGYLAGRWREGFDITSSLTPPLLAGGLTIVGGLNLAVIQLTLGVDAPISLAVIPQIVAQGVLSVALGAAAYPLIRRLVAPALIEDPSGPSQKVPVAPMRIV